MSSLMNTALSFNDKESDGFFGKIVGGIGDGLSTVGNKVIPLFAAQQLGLVEKDQATKVVVDPSFTRPTFTKTAQNARVDAPTRKAGVLFDNINISGAAIAIVAIAAVGFLLLKRI